MKKILSVLLTVVMLASFAMPVFAEKISDVTIEQIDSTEAVSDAAVESDVAVVTPDESESVAVDVIEPVETTDLPEQAITTEDEEAEKQYPVLDVGMLDEINDISSIDISFDGTPHEAKRLTEYDIANDLKGFKVHIVLNGKQLTLIDQSKERKSTDLFVYRVDFGSAPYHGDYKKINMDPKTFIGTADLSHIAVGEHRLEIFKYQNPNNIDFWSFEYDNPNMPFVAKGETMNLTVTATGCTISNSASPCHEHDVLQMYNDTYLPVADKDKLPHSAGTDAIYAEAERIMGGLGSDSEKVKAFHDWICKNIVYDWESFRSGNVYNAADPVWVFNNKRAVCSGYSRLARLMLISQGIPCFNVDGYANGIGAGGTANDACKRGSDEINHEWNVVYYNNAWHIMDFTWDSGGTYEYRPGEGTVAGGCKYNYYSPTGYVFGMDHHTVEQLYAPPKTNKKIANFVERLYTTALGRASEPDGKQAWTAYLVEGKATGAEAGKAFMLGQEFENRKLSNEDFLNVVYQTYFGRNPDEGGYNAWLNFLNNGYSREGVICAFAVSKEFQGICDSYGMTRGTITSSQNRDKNPTLTAFVNRIYTKLLDRDAEPDGLNAWTGAILKGDFTVKQTAVIFVESKEFLAHNYSTEDYVTHLYRMFFGREPEKTGFDKWVKYIDDGKITRTGAAEAFADSKEFAAIMKDAGV